MFKKSLSILLVLALMLILVPGAGAENSELIETMELSEQDLAMEEAELDLELAEEAQLPEANPEEALEALTEDNSQSSTNPEETLEVGFIDDLELLQNGDFPDPTVEVETFADYSEAKAYLHQEMLKLSPEINVEEYQIPISDISGLIQDLVNSTPDLFIFAGQYSFYQNQEEMVVSILPNYIDQAEAKLAEYQEIVGNIFDNLVAQMDSSMSNREKILLVQDYLAANYRYDYTYTIYNAYDFFVKKTGVCQAYTLAVTELFNRLNIPVSYASSPFEVDNHIWNVVQVDGKWYHLDVTHNSGNFQGKVEHDHYLVSTEQLQSVCNLHHDFQCKYIMDDKTYDDYFWKNVTQSFAYSGENWYYGLYDPTSRLSSIYQWEPTNNQHIVEKNLDFKWKHWTNPDGYYPWPGFYSGLNYYKGSLIYNGPQNIYAYDLATKQQNQLFAIGTSEGYVYGFALDNGILSYQLAQDPNNPGSVYQLPLAGNQFAGSLLDLSEGINLEFLVPKTAFLGSDLNNSGVRITKDVYQEDGTVIVEEFADIKAAEAKAQGNNYVFSKPILSSPGITAKEMTADLHASLYLAGEGVVDTLDSCVVDKVRDTFEQAPDSVKTVLIDMVNYGAEAQKYLQYNLANLANDPKFIDPAWQAYATSEDPILLDNFNKIPVAGAVIHNLNLNLILENRVGLGVQAVDSNGALDLNNLQLSAYNSSGVLICTVLGTEQDFLQGFAEFNCWNMQQLRDEFTLKIFDIRTNQQVSDTFVGSIAGYAGKVKANQDYTAYAKVYPVLANLFKFGDSLNRK